MPYAVHPEVQKEGGINPKNAQIFLANRPRPFVDIGVQNNFIEMKLSRVIPVWNQTNLY